MKLETVLAKAREEAKAKVAEAPLNEAFLVTRPSPPCRSRLDVGNSCNFTHQARAGRPCHEQILKLPRTIHRNLHENSPLPD